MSAPAASVDEVWALVGHLQEARESERRRMARVVHDVVGQTLVSLNLDVSWIFRQLTARPDHDVPLDEDLGAVTQRIGVAIAAMRKMEAELRPPVLDDLGLLAAIEWLAASQAKATGRAVRLSLTEAEPLLLEGCRVIVFRILETVLSALAGASDLRVRAAASGRTLRLAVRAEGAADLEPVTLLALRERARSAGGKLQVRRSGGGLAVTLRVPLADGGR